MAMKLNHEAEYICVCERWEEPVLYPVAELIRCRDCKWYKTNYTWNCREVKVCVIEAYEPIRKDDDYCSHGERKEE